MRTRIDVLREKLREAEDAFALADKRRSMASAMLAHASDETAFPDLHCTGCGEALRSELEFSMHFNIPDSRYPNLGNCPREKGKRR